MRSFNILLSGTPGTGKSLLAERLCERLEMKNLDVSEFAKSNSCLDTYNDEYKSFELDEDRLLDLLEEEQEGGGVVMHYHSCELFPERWFQYVFVLRADIEVLTSRYEQRSYNGKKLEDNLQCEIFQVLLDEARDSYDESIVFELHNNNMNDLSKNVDSIVEIVSRSK